MIETTRWHKHGCVRARARTCVTQRGGGRARIVPTTSAAPFPSLSLLCLRAPCCLLL
jgi:hypothetical protein